MQTRPMLSNSRRQPLTAIRSRLARRSSKQFVSSGARDVDIVACVAALGLTRGQSRHGSRWSASRRQEFLSIDGDEADAAAALDAFIAQHYRRAPAPAVIVVNRRLDAQPLEQLFPPRPGTRCESARAIGERRTWLSMTEPTLALRSPRGSRSRLLSTRHCRRCRRRSRCRVRSAASSASISATLSAKPPSARASCSRTAACRTASIDGSTLRVTPGDDYGAMRDVLVRRYRKVAAGRVSCRIWS